MIDKINNLINKHEQLSNKMISPDVMSDMKSYARIAKEHKSLENIVIQGKKYISLLNQLQEYEEVMSGAWENAHRYEPLSQVLSDPLVDNIIEEEREEI